MKVGTGIVLTFLSASAAEAAPRQDGRDYAIASCLIHQNASQVLRAEGYRLAEVVIARGGTSPPRWKPLDLAVATALARQGLLMVHIDAPVAQATQPAVLASCLQVIDSAVVKRTMAIVARPRRR